MPFVVTDGVRHYYRLTGTAGRPVVMLSHSLGLDHGMWDPQAAELERHFQVLRYDLRGHGASDAPEGEYSIEQLGRDALALANALGVQTLRVLRTVDRRDDRTVDRGACAGAADAPRARQHDVAHGRPAGDGGAAADGARPGNGRR